jgi:tetratricopeptide (TPR) repeat protein
VDGCACRSIHDAEGRRGPVRASTLVGAIVLLTVSCGSKNEPKVDDRRTLQEVVLPDLSRLEDSVQTQLRERYVALTAKQKDPGARAVDLAAEYGEMGKLLLAAEFHDPAVAALFNAQALAPDDMRWPYYLGHLYRTKGDIPNAMTGFERALRLAPNDVPTMIWLAEAALDRGRPDAAEPLLTKALSLQPHSVAAHYGLGRTALAEKDYVRAAQNLEQALALDSKATIIHYSLAMAYRGLGDHRRAESHLRQRGSLQIQPDPLRKALDELLDSALSYERNADIAGNRGEWASAAEYLGKAVVLAPTRASPRHKLGTALFYMGDRRGAFEQFQEALRLSPGFAAAHYAIGVIQEDAGDHQQAIRSFRSALESDPLNVDARLGLADALRRNGQPEQSLSEYEHILRIDPGVSKARVGYEAALSALKRTTIDSPR